MDFWLFLTIVLGVALGVALGIDIAKHPKEYLGNLWVSLFGMGVFIIAIITLGLVVVSIFLVVFVPETRGFLLAVGIVVFALMGILGLIIEIKNKGLKRIYRDDTKKG